MLLHITQHLSKEELLLNCGKLFTTSKVFTLYGDDRIGICSKALLIQIDLESDADAAFLRIDSADGCADGVVTKEGWLSLLSSDADVRRVLHLNESAGDAEAKSMRCGQAVYKEIDGFSSIGREGEGVDDLRFVDVEAFFSQDIIVGVASHV